MLVRGSNTAPTAMASGSAFVRTLFFVVNVSRCVRLSQRSRCTTLSTALHPLPLLLLLFFPLDAHMVVPLYLRYRPTSFTTRRGFSRYGEDSSPPTDFFISARRAAVASSGRSDGLSASSVSVYLEKERPSGLKEERKKEEEDDQVSRTIGQTPTAPRANGLVHHPLPTIAIATHQSFRPGTWPV